MLVNLDRIAAGEFHGEGPRRLIRGKGDQIGGGDTPNLRQPHAGLEPFLDAVPVEDAFHAGRVGLAPKVTRAGDDSAGVVPADHLDQVAAILSHGMGIVNDEPPAVEVDQPLGKADQFIQLQIRGLHRTPFPQRAHPAFMIPAVVAVTRDRRCWRGAARSHSPVSRAKLPPMPAATAFQETQKALLGNAL